MLIGSVLTGSSFRLAFFFSFDLLVLQLVCLLVSQSRCAAVEIMTSHYESGFMIHKKLQTFHHGFSPRK
jgi:hypothetical protein